MDNSLTRITVTLLQVKPLTTRTKTTVGKRMIAGVGVVDGSLRGVRLVVVWTVSFSQRKREGVRAEWKRHRLHERWTT